MGRVLYIADYERRAPDPLHLWFSALEAWTRLWFAWMPRL